MIFDDYYLHTVAAQAVRNRLTHLVGWLRKEVARVTVNVALVRILSLGSGPARELRLLAEEPAFREAVAVTCLDFDPQALRYARGQLDGWLNGRVTYVRDNALRFASGPHRPVQPYHLIYAAGLFDYLNPTQASRLIEDCHGLLASGGRLLVGNFCVELPANERALIE